jgi:hypothetical protein
MAEKRKQWESERTFLCVHTQVCMYPCFPCDLWHTLFSLVCTEEKGEWYLQVIVIVKLARGVIIRFLGSTSSRQLKVDQLRSMLPHRQTCTTLSSSTKLWLFFLFCYLILVLDRYANLVVYEICLIIKPGFRIIHNFLALIMLSIWSECSNCVQTLCWTPQPTLE